MIKYDYLHREAEKMKKAKKLLAVIMAAVMLTVFYSAPVIAQTDYSETGYSISEKIEHVFYQFVDKLIDLIGKMLNTIMPGLNWTSRIGALKNHTPETDFMGEDSFETTVSDNARWQMGFADASLLAGLDIMDGSYYVAGSLEAMNGRTPTEIIDDQTVNTYAISDGVSGTVVHVVLDGYGIARGDVLEIRRRLADFAEANDIIAINVSVLHQHSCIDTLGLSAPLLPALAKNPIGTVAGQDTNELSGKNDAFMENLFDQAVLTVKAAVNGMTEGTLSYGSTDITEYIHDKREPIVFDNELHRLRFVPEDKDKNEIWVCEAGIHCVSFGASADVVSADYPYYLKQYVKNATGADLVFIEGAELAITADYSTLSYQDTPSTARLEAMGKALGDKLININNETELEPVLNIQIREMRVTADNQILVLAVREGLVNSVVAKDGLNYILLTEIGYMELGNRLGILLSPGETAPEILWGGATPADASWNGESWDYPALKDVCGAEKLICFGLCNDQIGYIICDNDVRSYLTENEEITASSTTAASTLAKSFIDLINNVK